MTKAQWQKHRNEVGPHSPEGCAECQARMKTRKANAARRMREEAYRDAGLVCGRDSMGRKIWE